MLIKTKKKVALEWFAMDDVARFKAALPMDKQKLARHLRVSLTTIKEWESRYFANRIGENLEEAGKLEVVEGDVVDYSRDEVQEVLDALHQMATKGKSAFAAKTFLQAKGEFIEKSEVKVGLTADEIARQHLENRRWLRENGYLEKGGIRQVQSKSPLLPK